MKKKTSSLNCQWLSYRRLNVWLLVCSITKRTIFSLLTIAQPIVSGLFHLKTYWSENENIFSNCTLTYKNSRKPQFYLQINILMRSITNRLIFWLSTQTPRGIEDVFSWLDKLFIQENLTKSNSCQLRALIWMVFYQK